MLIRPIGRLSALLSPVVLALLAAAMIVSLSGWQILRARREALRQAEVDARILTRTLAQHAGRTVAAVDLSLSAIVDQVQAGRDPHAVMDYVRKVGVMQQLHNLAVTDETGRWLADTAPPHPAMSSGDRPYFQWFTTHDDRDLYFAPIVIGRTSGKPGFPISRRIDHPDGSFAGVAVATFAPEYFADFYRTVRLGDEGTVTLWTADGTLLVRYPQPSGPPSPARLAETARIFASKSAGLIRSASPWDGIERLFAFEHVDGYPIIVSVGVSIDDALAPWRREALTEGGVVAAAVFVFCLLGIALQRHQRRLALLGSASREAEQERAEAEARFRRQLTEANRLLRLAEEIAQSGHWRFELPTGRLTWSEEVYRIHGRDPDTFSPSVDAAISHYHPDDRAEVERLIGEAVAAGRPFRHDLRIVRADGALRHVISRGVCELDRDGHVTALFGTFMDVTELREAESALAASEARYRLLADNTTDMVTHMDLDGERLFVSPASRDLLGYGPDELVGTRPQNMIHPDDAPGLAAVFADLAQGRRKRAVNVNRLRHRDGRWIWVEASLKAIDDDEGRPVGFVGAIRDITDRKLAHEALHDSETRYKVLAETTSDVITQLDLSLHRTYASPSCRTIFGYDPAEMVGIKPSTTIHPDDAGAIRTLAEQLAAGDVLGDRIVATYRSSHRQGHWIWIEAFVSLIRDEATGAPRSLICSLRDVTHRRLAAEQLEQAWRAAEAAAKAKAEFLANMSHELRTPLAGIIGVHDLLRADPHLTIEQRRLVSLAGDAGRSLLTVVNDVLDFSKIDAGQLAIEKLAFDADELFTGCCELGRGTLGDKPIDLRLVRRPQALGSLEGDPTRIRQVLLNFLTNAVKFTARGEITIEAAFDETASVLRVEVADTGIGIPVDRIETLFERFTQADASMSRRYGGTGLGLAICNRLVELMRGRIGARNRREGGSLFWFELPLKRPADAVGAHAAAKASGPFGSGRRILLAEDNALNAEIVTAMLTSRSYQVTWVVDGAAAIEAFRSGDFDLVLMDMQMPILDGLGASRRLREREHAARAERTPIIGLTANAFGEDAKRCLDAGMDAHVPKPIDWRQLVETIERLTNARARARTAVRSHAPEPAPAVLETDRLEELAARLGREWLASMLAWFFDELRTKLAAREGTQEPDPSDDMHELASTAGRLGFAELSALCAAIDREAREGARVDRDPELRRAASRASQAIDGSRFLDAA